MYLIEKRVDTVRIPPDRLAEDYEKVCKEIAQETFEGTMHGNIMVVLVRDINLVGEGRMVYGDGAVYQQVEYESLSFEVRDKEVINGFVCEIVKFGAFIRFGPLDGLVHISQIASDHIDVDLANQRLIAAESKRFLKLEDEVRARIVSVAINDRSPRESKIGLTMKQPGLGKLEWLEEDRKKAQEGAK